MAGSKGKGNNTAGRSKVKELGQPIKLLNWGPDDWYCHMTGARLPRNGFAYKHEDKLFVDRDAIRKYEAAKGE